MDNACPSNITPGSVTCCRLTVGDLICDGQLLYIDPYLLAKGIEVQGGVGLVDHSEIMGLVENSSKQTISLPAGTNCGMATAVRNQDVVNWTEELYCYKMSCHAPEEPR